jgi:RNA polymerase sigma-54 factor
MDLGMQLNVSARLEQKLTPQMIQSLKLLQVNSQELELMIKQELEINPLLSTAEDLLDQADDQGDEYDDDAGESEEISEIAQEDAVEDLKEVEADDIDWDEYLNSGMETHSKGNDMIGTPEETLERTPTYESSFQENLLHQLHDRDVDSFLIQIVEYLIECLNDEGFLEASPLAVEEIQFGDISPKLKEALIEVEKFLRIDLEVIEKPETQSQHSFIREALHVLHTLEPIGIGARNLQECLLLQAYRVKFESPLVMPILENSFPMLQKVQVSLLAKTYETSPENIQKAFREIGNLDPRPARSITSNVSSSVIPDLILEIIDGEIRIALNDKNMPQLFISSLYSQMLSKGSRANKEEKKFIKDKLNSANWLIRAIDQRKSTMMKVMKAIVQKQVDFFERGPSYIKPMILQDIADIIEMHISTVNRVTNGKYVQTPMGVFELKYFFTAAVPQGDGEDVSSRQAKEAIKALIEDENPKKPLSDQKITDALKEQGLKVARRTIAKYREALGVSPARLRKHF